MEVNRTVTEILEQASEGQEIILEPEGECEDGEIEEIVEIIEEIEEVEEENEEEQLEELEEVEQVEEEEEEKKEIKDVQEQVIQRTNGAYKKLESIADQRNQKVNCFLYILLYSI